MDEEAEVEMRHWECPNPSRILNPQTLTRFDEGMDKEAEVHHRKAAGSALIVEAYIDMSEKAIQHLGKDNVLFGDWQT